MSIRNGLLQLIPLATLIGSTTMANTTAFDGQKPTCDKYVLNTYLYLTVALSLVVTLTLFMNAVVPNYTMTVFSSLMTGIIVLIIHVILMFYLRYLINTISPLEVKKKIAVWLLFIINITLFVLPSLQMMIIQNQGGLIVSTLLITLALTSALSIIAFYKPELIQTKKWAPYIIVALLGLILGYLIPLFTCLVGFCNNNFLNSWFYYLAILGVIIFCFEQIINFSEIIMSSRK